MDEKKKLTFNNIKKVYKSDGEEEDINKNRTNKN